MLPQIPAGDRAVGFPLFAHPLQQPLFLSPVIIELLSRPLQAQIPQRYHIESLEPEHQVHFRGPDPDALDCAKASDHLSLIHI